MGGSLKRFRNIPPRIRRKMSIIARLEFELTYFEVAVQYRDFPKNLWCLIPTQNAFWAALVFVNFTDSTPPGAVEIINDKLLMFL